MWVHTATKWCGWDLNPGSQTSSSCPPLLSSAPALLSPFLGALQQPLPTSAKPSLMPPRLKGFFLALCSHNALHIPSFPQGSAILVCVLSPLLDAEHLKGRSHVSPSLLALCPAQRVHIIHSPCSNQRHLFKANSVYITLLLKIIQ